MSAEEWRRVTINADYEVSSLGRVRSFKRGQVRILAGSVSTDGYRRVTLSGGSGSNSRYVFVHRIVTEAFLGPKPEGLETRHLNGDPLDNRLENLAYGTQSENMQDRRIHGVYPMVLRAECIRGHPFDEANTRHMANGKRICRACCREAARRRYVPRKAS